MEARLMGMVCVLFLVNMLTQFFHERRFNKLCKRLEKIKNTPKDVLK